MVDESWHSLDERTTVARRSLYESSLYKFPQSNRAVRWLLGLVGVMRLMDGCASRDALA